MNNYLANPVTFLVQTLFGVYTLIILLRFLLQWVRAAEFNPISQFLVRATAPVLRPTRRFIPSAGNIDLAALIVAWLLKSIEILLVLLIHGADHLVWGAFMWSLPELFALLISFSSI